ncbi:hypothetical protein niasHT_011785 [Heterodera trifolii]|uniref:Uncharacterized protein n=1 Tax=Heterodera trifolii TaxID=157864 RepID=A0ABD2L551_9BILA
MISRKSFPQKQIQVTTQKTKKETAETQQQNGNETARRKTETEGQNDGKRQKKPTSLLKRKTNTTDELEQTNERKQKLMPKGQNEKMVQKQSKTEEKKLNNKPATTEQQTINGVNPLDTILDEIEAFDTANKKKKVESEDDEADNAPCSSRQLPPTPMPGSYRSLNRMELARQDQDHGMVHSFLERDDLMQRILAYKMLKGRVESYSTIRIKIDLDNCTIPDYELSPTEFDTNFSAIPSAATIDDVAVGTKPDVNSSETPEQSALKRGPMTPPGSPGTNLSSAPEAEAKPTGSILPNQNLMAFKKEIVASAEENASKEMLTNFCSVTGFSVETIRAFLGDELHKLDKLKMDDLLTTFLASLKKVATKKDRESDKECSTTNVKRSPVPSVVLPKDENKSIGSEGLPKVQAEQRAADNLEMDAMEISSQSAVSSGELSFSNGLLPPPPAPPPILDDTDCEASFIVPPPPPPPPLHEENASFLLQSSSLNQNRFTLSPPSQIMAKVSPPNIQRSPHPIRSSENLNTYAFITDQEHFPAVVQQFKRHSRRSKTNRGKQFPLRFPKPMKALSRRGNIGERIGGLHRKMVATTSTMETTRPVPLLSLNLTEPTPETVLRKTDEMPNNTVGTSVQRQQQTNCLKKVNDNDSQQPKPSREVPIMVDLEFIRNTPPPPIPDIIKRRTTSDNRVAAMRMLPPQIPIASQPPKIPPQPLLRMDLPTPPIFLLRRPPPTFRQPNIPTIPPLPPLSLASTPNASAVLQTVVQAIGGSIMPPLAQAQKAPIFQRHPPPNVNSSPYGKFF